MARPRSLTVIASLALVQGFLGALVGLVWLQVVSLLEQEAGEISSLIVIMAEARGWALIVLSMLYFLFAVGAWQTRPWAWWIGLLVPVLTLLYLVGVLTRGGSVVLVFVWLIVPFIMVWYLITPQGRQAFGRYE
jgi:hypothetical protein